MNPIKKILGKDIYSRNSRDVVGMFNLIRTDLGQKRENCDCCGQNKFNCNKIDGKTICRKCSEPNNIWED
jgi:hypothetical protein